MINIKKKSFAISTCKSGLFTDYALFRPSLSVRVYAFEWVWT